MIFSMSYIPGVKSSMRCSAFVIFGDWFRVVCAWSYPKQLIIGLVSFSFLCSLSPLHAIRSTLWQIAIGTAIRTPVPCEKTATSSCVLHKACRDYVDLVWHTRVRSVRNQNLQRFLASRGFGWWVCFLKQPGAGN